MTDQYTLDDREDSNLDATVGDLIVDGHRTETIPVRTAVTRSEQVTTTVKPSTLAQLDQVAAAAEISRASLVLRYILEGLESDLR